MGKRGPAPKGEFSDKSKVISTRIRADTREALEAAAAASGRSLSQEIERRLRRSFDIDRGSVAHLGGPQMYAILRTISAVMDLAGKQAFFFRNKALPENTDWLRDPYAYDQAMRAVAHVLEGFRPPGDPSPPALRPLVDEAGNSAPPETMARVRAGLARAGEGSANRFLGIIDRVEPGQPLPSDGLTAEEAVAQRIKDDLGPIAGHLKKDDRNG